MSRIGAWIVHDVAEHSRRLHDQLLRFLSLGASVAHPACFLEVDRLDERFVVPEAGPSGIVKALAIFCPDALLGKQALVESHQVGNKIGIVLGAVSSGVVQWNDVAHGPYLRSEDSLIVPAPKRAVACRQLSGATSSANRSASVIEEPLAGDSGRFDAKVDCAAALSASEPGRGRSFRAFGTRRLEAAFPLERLEDRPASSRGALRCMVG